MSDEGPRDVWAEPLPADEFERLLRRALTDLDGEEGEEMRAFMAWFVRRYPTPLERLRYTTRKYKEWSSTRGIARHPR